MIERRPGFPQEMVLLPISTTAIKTSELQISNDPVNTCKEDLEEIRSTQPVINRLIEKNPYGKKGLDIPSYIHGITRGYRYLNNQAKTTLTPLPVIPDEYFDLLIETIKEDIKLKTDKKYTRTFKDKLSTELRVEQKELWQSFQDIFGKTKHYESFMTGLLSVFYLFKAYQENDYFERLLDFKG